MRIEELGILMAEHPEVRAMQQTLAESRGRSCHLSLQGLHASARSLILNALACPTLFIMMDSQDEAQYMFSDLLTLGANVLYFPSARRRRQGVDEAMVIQRTEVLAKLTERNGDAKLNGVNGERKGWSVWNLIVLAIATSIDALATGVIFIPVPEVLWLAIGVIAFTSFAFSIAGYLIGVFVGNRFKLNVELIGGLILIAIGLKIWIEGVIL